MQRISALFALVAASATLTMGTYVQAAHPASPNIAPLQNTYGSLEEFLAEVHFAKQPAGATAITQDGFFLLYQITIQGIADGRNVTSSGVALIQSAISGPTTNGMNSNDLAVYADQSTSGNLALFTNRAIIDGVFLDYASSVEFNPANNVITAILDPTTLADGVNSFTRLCVTCPSRYVAIERGAVALQPFGTSLSQLNGEFYVQGRRGGIDPLPVVYQGTISGVLIRSGPIDGGGSDFNIDPTVPMPYQVYLPAIAR